MHQLPYPTIDRELGEKLQPDEEIIANQITEQIVQSIRSQYSSGNALRDAHPKRMAAYVQSFMYQNLYPKT
jgi:NH3-dependent NAD+ synthetase